MARVKLSLDGEKNIIVNGKPIEEYFQGEICKHIYLEPLRTTNTVGRYTIAIKVEGSGKNSQLGAVVHGIARALNKADSDKFHTTLRHKGMLTRDSRTRERRKVGHGGKARRAKQSPKR